MKAKELIEKLSQLDPDEEIFIYDTYWLDAAPIGSASYDIDLRNKFCIMQVLGGEE